MDLVNNQNNKGGADLPGCTLIKTLLSSALVLTTFYLIFTNLSHGLLVSIFSNEHLSYLCKTILKQYTLYRFLVLQPQTVIVQNTITSYNL